LTGDDGPANSASWLTSGTPTYIASKAVNTDMS
jgi:hypothetical protein